MSSPIRLRATVAALASAGVLAAGVGTLPATADTAAIAPPALTAPSGVAVGAGAAQSAAVTQYFGLTPAFAAVRITGTRVTTANVNLRRGPGRSYHIIKVLRRGTVVQLAGSRSHGFAKVTVGSRRGWVATRYLAKRATTAPVVVASSKKSYASVERHLTAKTIRVHRAVRAAFPQIKTVYGYRPGTSGEHRLGRALDFMLPGNYHSASARALGKRIATWARSHAAALDIWYVVWDQHIWNTQRDREGWRLMSNRGSDTANHKNHVHISVKA